MEESQDADATFPQSSISELLWTKGYYVIFPVLLIKIKVTGIHSKHW